MHVEFVTMEWSNIHTYHLAMHNNNNIIAVIVLHQQYNIILIVHDYMQVHDR